ncbi:MAG: universal stress protein, partial [Actinomycetota bacterium]|nr:universal stress protein [Actinomycetota bacterium]
MSHGRGPSHPERDDRLDPGGQAEAPQAQSERFVPDPVEHEAAEKSASPAADDPQARNGTANQAPQGEIVVGVDGSDAAQAALHWALRYRGLTGGPIHAVAVWQHPPPVGDAPPMSSDEDLEQETDRLLSR